MTVRGLNSRPLDCVGTRRSIEAKRGFCVCARSPSPCVAFPGMLFLDVCCLFFPSLYCFEIMWRTCRLSRSYGCRRSLNLFASGSCRRRDLWPVSALRIVLRVSKGAGAKRWWRQRCRGPASEKEGAGAHEREAARARGVTCERVGARRGRKKAGERDRVAEGAREREGGAGGG